MSLFNEPPDIVLKGTRVSTPNVFQKTGINILLFSIGVYTKQSTSLYIFAIKSAVTKVGATRYQITQATDMS